MELKELLDKCINDRLIDLTISGQKVKDEEGVMRVKIRPVQLKDGIKYQASEFVGRKVLHTNYSEEEIKTRITEYMENTFKQAQFNMTDATATVLSSKKGACTCKYKKLAQIKSQNDMSHNRTKTYILKGYNIRIIGLDLKKDVIEHCNQLRTKYGYDRLDFYEGDIASYKGVDSVDMVVTLHACDTATDYALAKAVKWGAKVILSVPCCQHEANRTIADDTLSPVMDYGILKERFAAIATDGARAKLLESKGYQTQILEFIDMEHTPKNLLIRAVKTGKPDAGAYKEVLDMSEALNIDLTLKKLLED